MHHRYVDSSSPLPNASSGKSVLFFDDQTVRPKIGGGRRIKTKKGGFVPSVMEGFVSATGRYVVPMAMYAGYKLLHRTSDKSKNRRRKSKKTNKKTKKSRK